MEQSVPMLELELETMTPGGEALARHEGMVIFVPFGVPGERVRVRITQRKKRFARADIVDVLRVAPHRVEPGCRYFGICGGCEWQQIEYATQLRYKQAIVAEQFSRIGKFEDAQVLPCISSSLPYGYRNRARLARSPRNRPGYRAVQSHNVVEVDDCPILETDLNRCLHEIALIGLPAGDGDWELRPDASTVRVGEFRYAVSPDSFFQVNTLIAARLVDEVLTRLDLRGDECILDLYCGVGLFTLPLSLRSAHVTGVEFSPSATVDAAANLAALRPDHPHVAETAILTAAVEDALARPQIADQCWDAIVLDPPRAGVDRAALDRILALRPPQIVYVSCDPATLARDARILADGGYVLGPIQPLDMFPQTHHVESVVRFALG